MMLVFCPHKNNIDIDIDHVVVVGLWSAMFGVMLCTVNHRATMVTDRRIG
jgi:hypothetical protein